MSPVRILLLEDNLTDAELVQELLEADGFVCEITRVQTRAEFLTGLADHGISLILSDYQLPSFDGLSALNLALNARPDVPFIFVSGTLGEEAAIDALKIGATDYVLKTGLSRLAPAMHRALREAHERTERKKAEEALRRSEAYLAEAQRLSHTGSFGWNVATGELVWSEETYRIFGCELTVKPTLDLAMDRTHPDDRGYFRQIINHAAVERAGFTAERRLIMPNGSVKYVRVVAYPAEDEDPENFFYVGAVIDITERKRAEEEREKLRCLEADLAYINRVSMMGELAASLAHEIKQPITAAVMDAKTCVRWLVRDGPDIARACEAASRTVADAMRAADIVDRVRSLYGREAPQRELLDPNEIVRHMVRLLNDRANQYSVSIRTGLAAELAMITADRVQLQQVLMNLMLNGIEAMKDTGGELNVTSKRSEDGQVMISVSDSGIGLPVSETERIFDAFFTTKAHGTGMGLSISRRIIESHSGRLWATANAGRGATFHFTLPSAVAASSHSVERAF